MDSLHQGLRRQHPCRHVAVPNHLLSPPYPSPSRPAPHPVHRLQLHQGLWRQHSRVCHQAAQPHVVHVIVGVGDGQPLEKPASACQARTHGAVDTCSAQCFIQPHPLFGDAVCNGRKSKAAHLPASPAAATSATQRRLNSSRAPSSLSAYLRREGMGRAEADCWRLQAYQLPLHPCISTNPQPAEVRRTNQQQQLTVAWGLHPQTAPA